MDGTLLSWLIGLPLLTGVVLLALPGLSDRALRGLALAGALAAWVVSLVVWQRCDPSSAAMQLEEQRAWITAIGASYHLGIDGISLVLVMLTTVLTPLAVLGSAWSIRTRVREFLAFFLLLEAAMLGVFLALDLLLFYIFWEAMLIPMAFLIGIWGGPRRVYAAVKFFLYTMAGSVLMLVAILYLVWSSGAAFGQPTFDLLALRELPGFTPHIEHLLFLAFALAFAIKVPLFPFHTWLPDAHVEAPTAGSVILAGVLLKMGTYGMLRFCLPLFPRAALALAPWLVWLALAGIIYGALMALAQDDLKKLVAYSSVSHMGWIILGLFALNLAGFEGGVLQMINHGVNTGALFLLVGMIYDRAHTREIGDFGGVARTMPVFAALAMIFTLASIGLPGTNGFVGEFSILVGAFQARPLYAILAALGVVLGAVYMLYMYKRVFFGKAGELAAGLRDIGAREVVALLPLAALVFWLGVQPGSWMERARPALAAIYDDLHRAPGEEVRGGGEPAPPAGVAVSGVAVSGVPAGGDGLVAVVERAAAAAAPVASAPVPREEALR